MNPTLLLLGVLALPSGDWPCWRGPDRDGVSRETNWSTAGREVWRANVGLGYSACVVAGGRLFTMGHDEEREEDTIYALDAATGEVLWTHVVPAELRANFHGGGALTTAAVDGDALYVVNREGRAFRFDAATGAVVWEKNYTEELGLSIPIHGFPNAPIVIDGVVLLPVGGLTMAVAKEDGSVTWKTEPRPGGAYSTPTPFEHGGRKLLALFASRGLAVLDRTNGEELAFHEFFSDVGVNAASPIVVGDRVFVSAAYNVGCAMLQFTGDALEVVWESKRMRNKVQTSVLWDGHLYGFDEAILKCLNLAGEEQWRKRGLGMGALTVSDGRLLVTSSKGELIVAAASPEGYEELAREKVMEGGVYWTAPTLADGRVYLRNSLGEVLCRDHRGEAVASAGAPGVPATAYLPAAEELFAAHVAAVGGAEVWGAVRALRLDGVLDQTASGVTGAPTTLLFQAPDTMRMTVDLAPYGMRERGYTGGEEGLGWKADAFFGPELLEADELRELKDEARLLRHVEWRGKYPRVRTVARTGFDDRDCWRVEAATAGGHRRTLYFEVASGLLAGHEAEAEALVTYRDYAPFGAAPGTVRLPRYRRSLAADTGEEEVFRVTEASFEPIEPEAFELPAAVQQLLMSPEEIEAANKRIVELYGDLLGTYVSVFDGEEDVPLIVQRGHLAFEFGEDNASPLAEPGEGDDRWRFVGMESMWVRFQRDEDGAVTGLVFHSPDGDMVWPRKDAGG